MIARLAAAALALVLVVGLATGCQPEPEPTPSGPLFATEQEAFAAAEETYRAHIDAINLRREDPSSQPDPEEFLTGRALESDIETQRQFDQAGLKIVGPSEIVAVDFVSADLPRGTVVVDVCLDSSAARLIDDAGVDVTPIDRAPESLLTVEFIAIGSELLIEAGSAKDVTGC